MTTFTLMILRGACVGIIVGSTVGLVAGSINAQQQAPDATIDFAPIPHAVFGVQPPPIQGVPFAPAWALEPGMVAPQGYVHLYDAPVKKVGCVTSGKNSTACDAVIQIWVVK